MYVSSEHFVLLWIWLSSICGAAEGLYDPCRPKDFGHGSNVCVCTPSYCDGFRSTPTHQDKKDYVVYTSSKSGKRFEESPEVMKPLFYEGFDSLWADNESSEFPETRSADLLTININTGQKRQEILGFGGAFTDAATINIFEMPSSLQDKVFSSYFSEEGIEYSIGRIPMASCDFSTHVYSYDDHKGDFLLANFSLALEDEEYKIPGIKAAVKHAKHKLKLFGSPWSSPFWLKSNGKMQGPGTLIGKAGDKYHKTWANYFINFLKLYESAGVPRLWGLTVENEPSACLLPSYDFQCLGFTAESERDFIVQDLGPALVTHNYGDVNLMILDDQRYFLPTFADVVLKDPQARSHIKGIGIHWYGNGIAPAPLLDVTHKRHPDIFMLATEACTGSQGSDRGVLLGSWERGEQYSHDILENLNHWVTGWVDWNLVLNMQGGPNWIKNFVDAPIIWDKRENVFYKQPMFYHMGHFSKFIHPGSKYVESNASEATTLEFAAFLRADNSVVLVVLNRESSSKKFAISASGFGTVPAEIPERAIQTYVLSRGVY